jgi:hypothetical protein
MSNKKEKPKNTFNQPAEEQEKQPWEQEASPSGEQEQAKEDEDQATGDPNEPEAGEDQNWPLEDVSETPDESGVEGDQTEGGDGNDPEEDLAEGEEGDEGGDGEEGSGHDGKIAPNLELGMYDEFGYQLPKTKNTSTRLVKCKLTTERMAELGQELADLQQRKEELEGEKKAAVSQIKSQIDGVDADVRVVINKIQNGFEQHNHKVHVFYDPDKALKYYVDIETNEKVDQDKMDAADFTNCQLSLF